MHAPINHSKSSGGVADSSESELVHSIASYIPYLQCVAFKLVPLIVIYYYHSV
jgi:hypothetical protein